MSSYMKSLLKYTVGGYMIKYDSGEQERHQGFKLTTAFVCACEGNVVCAGCTSRSWIFS